MSQIPDMKVYRFRTAQVKVTLLMSFPVAMLNVIHKIGELSCQYFWLEVKKMEIILTYLDTFMPKHMSAG